MKWINSVILFILMVPALVFAEPKVSKDWTWDLSGEKYVYAATINSDGRVLGQYCYFDDGVCYYLVNLGILCDSGSEYPSILNSNAGFAQVSLVCGPDNVFFIKPFDDVDNLLKQANNVGFAVAMEEGVFKVVRFSLSGSTYAIEMMRAGAEIINDAMNKSRKKLEATSEEYM